MGVIDQTSEPGKRLQAVVKEELKGYLGADYSDECLPLYIVVMLAQGTQLPAVTENLIAFLGDGKAEQFATWYVSFPSIPLTHSERRLWFTELQHATTAPPPSQLTGN